MKIVQNHPHKKYGISPMARYQIQRRIRMWKYEKHINDLLMSITHDYYMSLREQIIQRSQLVSFKIKKVTDIGKTV